MARQTTFYNAFQPTPPTRGATEPPAEPGDDVVISTHAPHTGGDIPLVCFKSSHHISTHAPHTGGDQYRDLDTLIKKISTHAPHTGGDWWPKRRWMS